MDLWLKVILLPQKGIDGGLIITEGLNPLQWHLIHCIHRIRLILEEIVALPHYMSCYLRIIDVITLILWMLSLA